MSEQINYNSIGEVITLSITIGEQKNDEAVVAAVDQSIQKVNDMCSKCDAITGITSKTLKSRSGAIFSCPGLTEVPYHKNVDTHGSSVKMTANINFPEGGLLRSEAEQVANTIKCHAIQVQKIR